MYYHIGCENFPMNLKRNVLLIDTSCYIFACYTGIVSWYRNEMSQIIDHATIMTNKEFINKYTYMFKNILLKFQKRYNIPNYNVVIAKDCSRSSIWRNDIFPDYKKNRDDRSGNKFNACIFKYTYSTIIKALNDNFGFKIIEIERAEADDIIALCSKTIHSMNPNTNIYIVSNDKDYIQLVDNFTHVMDMKCIPLINSFTNNPQDYLMAKIILGDKSDNIPPIARRIGKKRAISLINNPLELDRLLKNDQVRQQYELNKMLIDFSNIPNSLRSNIKHKFEEFTKYRSNNTINTNNNRPYTVAVQPPRSNQYFLKSAGERW
jgi:5'-3' exonuclease